MNRNGPARSWFWRLAQNPVPGNGFMAWPIIVAWIHYVSIMLMIASLLGEHLLLSGK